MIPLVPTSPCGPCTLCCKVMGVKDVTPAGEWCQHAKKSRGCAIYDDRPQPCRDFQCLWVMGQFGEGAVELRPDRLHAVVTRTKDGTNIVVYEDAGWRGHARAFLHDTIRTYTRGDVKNYVIVVCGEERVFYGWKKQFEALQAQDSQWGT